MRKSAKLVHWLIFAGFLTASWDLLFSFGGLRFSSLCMAAVVMAGLICIAQRGRIRWPIGMTALLIWCVIQVLFVGQAKPLNRGLFYLFWLLLSTAFIGAMVQLYGRATDQMLVRLMRAYAWSYILVAAFGLVQFAGPAFHLPDMLVAQWLVYRRVPRINGFNYEPSYFAIYMVMGWVMLIDLRRSGSRVTQGRHMKWLVLMVTVVLVLCTSRTGWIFMMAEGLLLAWPWTARKMRRIIHRLQTSDLRWRYSTLWRRSAKISLVVVVLFGTGWTAYTKLDPAILLQGTGLTGTASYSYSDRVHSFADMKELILSHPLIGSSIGGVAGAQAQARGISNPTYDETKQNEAISVLLEVIVGSGWPGSIAFFVFFYYTVVWPWKLVRRNWPDERAKCLRALLLALAFEWALLSTADNPMRVSLWYTIALVAVMSYQLHYNPAWELANSDTALRARETAGLIVRPERAG